MMMASSILSFRLSPAINFSLNFSCCFNKSSSFPKSSAIKMALTITTSSSSTQRKLPVLLFDIMDTIVRDPFYHRIPAFFGMSMQELLECKHPTAWVDFEKGLIDEMELARIFFKDGRPIDLEGLKSCMHQAYSYVEGVEELLSVLKHNGYEMHAFTNYPIWYKMIEEKLKLSTYLSWTFCSCTIGKRKPDPLFYSEALKHLEIEPASCVFIDDRLKNVEAAQDAGITGIQFKNADSLHHDLSLLGVDVFKRERGVNQDLVDFEQKPSQGDVTDVVW